jgi:phospholipid/cholesterol/gamma-HCH transport system substrate-binding protein
MSSTAPHTGLARLAGLFAIVVAACALVFVLLNGSSYTIHAHFINASGLVDGGLVEVAGRKVGTVSGVSVTANGEADVTLSIDDRSITPLHQGTRASVRALGQAGITNHFVDLAPGADTAPVLPTGSSLSTEQTTSMVSLDAVLNAFGPASRAHLDQLIANSAQVFAGSSSRYFNRMLAKLDPALAEVAGLTGELAQDRTAIAQLIATGNQAAGAIASRSGDLQAAVANTARSLEAIASQRAALADVLSRAPSVLDQADGTLADVGTALTALRPALRDVVPTTPPLQGFLSRVANVLPRATPVVAQLRSQLPGLGSSLAGLAPLKAIAVRALNSAATALEVSRPIVRAARFYGSDFVLGILGGLVGAGAWNYSRWGHYERIDFIQPPQTAFGGPGSSLLQSGPLLPGIIDIKTHLFRRCPGGNVPPAIDGSTPWVPDPRLCTPSQDIPAAVNQP